MNEMQKSLIYTAKLPWLVNTEYWVYCIISCLLLLEQFFGKMTLWGKNDSASINLLLCFKHLQHWKSILINIAIDLKESQK